MPIPGPKEGVALKREAKTEAARIRPRMTHVDKAPSHRSEDEGDEPPSDEEKGEGAPTSSSSESETSDTSLTEFRAKYGAAHEPSSGVTIRHDKLASILKDIRVMIFLFLAFRVVVVFMSS